MLQESLRQLIDHLQDLKQSGVQTVSYSDQSVEQLSQLLDNTNKNSPTDKVHLKQPSHLMKSPTEPELFDLSDITIKPASKKRAPAKAKVTDPTLPDPPIITLPSGDKATQLAWLRNTVLECPTCTSRVKPNKQVVFGVGSVNADIFFCGEAPGAEEEIQGEPFVGPAGQLLTKIIQAMGLSRQKVYISNIMNWRPEMPTAFGNRPPTQQEMEFCLPYLKAQLDIVQPKLIVALGATAAHGLLEYDAKRKITECRGKWTAFEQYPLMITFHPSYLLRNNTNHSKRQVWEDMMEVMKRLELPISDKQAAYFL